MLPLAEVSPLPQFLAGEIVTVEPGRSVDDHDALAVRDGRGVTIRVALPSLFRNVVRHVLLPQNPAVGAREAEQTSNRAVLAPFRIDFSLLVLLRLRVLVCLGEKDFVAPDDWRRVSGELERNLPLHVFLAAP